MLHAEAVSFTSTDEAATVEIASSANDMPLDANGDGRVDAGELRSWLARWRKRRAAPKPEPVAAPRPMPDVLPGVDDFGGKFDWHLNTINAPEAWAAGHSGEGVTVAVIDTGADLRHPELRGRLWTNDGEIAGNGRDDDGNGFIDDIHGWDFVQEDATPQDRNGHGTHVASLIVAARDGVGSTGAAYGSELMVLQGLGADGVGDTRDIARAVRYAVDEGADIINVSLSSARSTSLEAAIRYASQHGVLVVAAAGNRGAAGPSAPASLSRSLTNVLAVGAFGQDSRLASFSNRAGGAVQVVAPGVRLRAAVPGGYAAYTGTSMAAPLVSSVAALALSANPHLTAAQLRELIVRGAARVIRDDDSSGAVNAAVSVAQAAKVSGQRVPSAVAARSFPNTVVRPMSQARQFRSQSLALAPLPGSIPLNIDAVDETMQRWAA